MCGIDGAGRGCALALAMMVGSRKTGLRKSVPFFARRSEQGVYMIEMLMAIATTAMLLAALCDNLSLCTRFATSGQNQALAFSIAQEQIDNTRNTPYGSLPFGTFTLLVNRNDSGQIGPAVNPRPLLLDTVNETWSTAARNNGFNGTVTETVSTGPYPNTKQVVITVTWTEGTATRNFQLGTLVSQQGIHN
jgi:type II secretory pathway pseudopilin PulG